MTTLMSMVETMAKVRLVLGVEGTVGVRIAPHKTDASKLVLKGSQGAAETLCMMMGVPAGKTWRGECYWLTEVNAEVFTGALPRLFKEAMDCARTSDALREQRAKVAAEVEAEDEGDGGEEDGELLPFPNAEC